MSEETEVKTKLRLEFWATRQMQEKLNYCRAGVTSVQAVVLHIINYRHFTPTATQDNVSSNDTSSFPSLALVTFFFPLQGLLLPRLSS